MLLKQIKHVNRTGFISKIRLIIFWEKVRQYCAEQKYDFVWFCKDIERVYTGKKVNAVDKKKKSEEFKKKKQISGVKVDKLSAAEYQENTSNILRILEQYLDMKR